MSGVGIRSSSVTVALSSSFWNKYFAAEKESRPEVLLNAAILGRICDPRPVEGIE